ncbi:Leucine-rich repeat-containing protein 74B [Varanus komodoensis]|nr:Leucine-rich repeat-containing protein 74B [Varanus komodoensis]
MKSKSGTQTSRQKARLRDSMPTASIWRSDPWPHSKSSYDPAGKDKYRCTCQMHGVVPVSYFLRHMKDSKLTLMHHGLGPKGARALALSLTSNTSIVKLNLSDNWLNGDGAAAIADTLKENDVDLSENRVGVKGAKALSAMLRENTTLISLDLSGNELSDHAARDLADALLTNNKMEFLNLSHNMLGEPSGEVLGAAVAENVGLKELNLSWNCFRGQGAVAVAKGLGANIFLRVLDLSYNGFGNSGAAALGEALKVNNVLEELHMARNPIQNDGCVGILKAVRANSAAVLEILDFSEIIVKQDFVGLCKAVQDMLPSLRIKHDGTSRLFRTDSSKGS